MEEPVEERTSEPAPSPISKNLVKKLLQAIAKLENIPKAGWNQHSDYRYIRVDDIAASVRKALADCGLVLLGDVVERRTGSVQTSGGKTAWCEDVMIRYTLTDGESQFQFQMPGSGQDLSDKALPKSISGSRKYALLTLLNLGGEDPETASLETSPPKAGPHPEAPQLRHSAKPPMTLVKPTGSQVGTVPSAPTLGEPPSEPMATMKQLGAIHALARACGVAEEQLLRGIKDGWGATGLDKLTRRQASEILDLLKQTQKHFPPLSQVHEGQSHG